MEPERRDKNHKLSVRVVGALKRGVAIFSFMPIGAKHVSQGLDLSHHRVPTVNLYINTLPIVIVTTYLLLVSVTVDMFTQLMLTGHNPLTERTWISLICAITMCVQSVDQCITVIFKPENDKRFNNLCEKKNYYFILKHSSSLLTIILQTKKQNSI